MTDNKLILNGTNLFTGVSLEETKLTCMASIISPDSPDDVEEDPNDETRAPVLLVAVVDKSGSMGGEKIKSLIETLEFIIKEMSKKDKLAIVEYDSSVNTTLPLTNMDEVGKQKANTIAKAIVAGTCTNMSGGLSAGLKLIPSELDNKTVVSTLLLTDGHANEGITSSSGMISMMRDIQKEGLGRCTLNTFGFGTDHNATMLKEMADAGEGMYYFIKDTDSIATSFADCLGGLLSVAAQSIELTIQAEGDNIIGRINTSKQVNEVEKGKKYRILVGDLQEGESRDIPFEITLSKCQTASDNFGIASLQLSYFNVKLEEMGGCTHNLKVVRDNNLSEEHKRPNAEVDKHVNRLLAADAAEEAAKLARENKIEEAKAHVQKTIDYISSATSANDELCQNLVAELETSKKGLVSRSHYEKEGQYQMNKFSKAMKMQRCSATTESAAPTFETKKRKMMKAKYSKKC